MGSLGAVEFVGFGVGFALLGSGIAVGVGDSGGFAVYGDEEAVHEGDSGEDAEGETEDVAKVEKQLLAVGPNKCAREWKGLA